MQVVILAAGEGVRIRPLTNDTPKALLKVAGKNLLENKLDTLPDKIDEIIIVIGYLGEQIKNYFGNSYNGKKITYVVQNEMTGTAGALWCVKDLIRNDFLVLMADDLYCKRDIDECLKHQWSILVNEEINENQEPIVGGNVTTDSEGKLEAIVEGEHREKIFKRSANVFTFGKEIFSYEPVPKAPNSDELGLPQTLVIVAQDIPVSVVKAKCWFKITDPSDIKKAERWLKENK